MPKLITKAWLNRRKACKGQVKVFTQEWPQGAEITLDNLLRAANLGLNIKWLGQHILSVPAQEEFYRATAPARAEFYRAIATILYHLYQETPRENTT